MPVVVGGITSDRLYPLRLQQELAEQPGSCSASSCCRRSGYRRSDVMPPTTTGTGQLRNALSTPPRARPTS
ncbi:hypothetical protein MAHJHV59_50250 [Mycobacterium avium subsp. hominissuis]